MSETGRSYETLQKDYFELEDKANRMEAKLTQLQHLATHTVEQVEEVGKAYRIFHRKDTPTGQEDLVTENIAELRSLIEISQDVIRLAQSE